VRFCMLRMADSSGRRLAKDATAGLVGRASAGLAGQWASCRCSAATSS